MATTIKLDKPIRWMGVGVTEIRLKEPTGQQFIDLGEPRVVVSNRNGSMVWAEIQDTIKAYLDRCIDHDGGVALVALLSLSDTRKLKSALFDFFLAAPATTTISRRQSRLPHEGDLARRRRRAPHQQVVRFLHHFAVETMPKSRR